MPSVEPDPSAEGCRIAFAALGPGSHTIEQLVPTVRQCQSLAMWLEAYQEYGGLGFGGTGVEVLRAVCALPEVSQEPLCGLIDS